MGAPEEERTQRKGCRGPALTKEETPRQSKKEERRKVKMTRGAHAEEKVLLPTNPLPQEEEEEREWQNQGGLKCDGDDRGERDETEFPDSISLARRPSGRRIFRRVVS